jgi:hypothetical protein
MGKAAAGGLAGWLLEKLRRTPRSRPRLALLERIAARVAAAAPAPLLPDLSQRLHPSDSTPWTILVVLTLITLLPAILMAMTPLVRLLVVFHFLRQALGTQTAPSNPNPDGAGPDDDLVSDDAGAQPGGSAGG